MKCASCGAVWTDETHDMPIAWWAEGRPRVCGRAKCYRWADSQPPRFARDEPVHVPSTDGGPF